jgi:NinB protein
MTTIFILKDEKQAQNLWQMLRCKWRIMAQNGKPLSVTVSEYKDKRSQERNRLYWSTLGEIAESAIVNDQKFGAESWHEFFKRYYIGCDELPGGGVIGMSTTKLSIVEFSEYVDKVQAYAATELGMWTSHD